MTNTAKSASQFQAEIEALLVTPAGETAAEKRVRFNKVASNRRWIQAMNDEARNAAFAASLGC